MLFRSRGRHHRLALVRSPARRAATGPSRLHQELPRSVRLASTGLGGSRADLLGSAADAVGWVSVDQQTTQHTKYPNVFSIGDGSSLPTSKTAAAISAQAPVLVSNLVSLIEGKPLTAKYGSFPLHYPVRTSHSKAFPHSTDGYTSWYALSPPAGNRSLEANLKLSSQPPPDWAQRVDAGRVQVRRRSEGELLVVHGLARQAALPLLPLKEVRVPFSYRLAWN